jgi:Domain of unknown function (DUF3846)
MKNWNLTRGILIDPFTETVSNVTLVDTKLQTIYNLLGCNLITITSAFGADMILDDEGLLKDSNSQAYFKIGIGSQPYAGKALLVGSDSEGNFASLSESLTTEKVFEKVIFFKPSENHLEESREIKFIPF